MPNMRILGCNLKILLTYLKSWNLLCCKVWCKTKNLYIWDQIYVILVFLDWMLKTILSYLKSASLNLSNYKFS